VRIGDAVTTLVTVKALDATKAQATLETVCSVNGKAVVEGEALIMVPRLVVSSQGA
jgi:3-hydroxybutyryl-CoA dehydratase